jgi:hypothetical protein
MCMTRTRHDETRQDEVIAAATVLAERCGYDRPHTEQVTRLALSLLDKLAALHGLGEPERLLLHCAGLLHDIGWCEGANAHHKTAMRLILADRTIPLDERERAIVSCVARARRGRGTNVLPLWAMRIDGRSGCWRACCAWPTGWITRTARSCGIWTWRFGRGESRSSAGPRRTQAAS